eukprot:TRINITY_DN9959_c0_g1_i3.p2 TRINITY_DN9959_c0_g1~~TRINITY_DN9959_c0_g1_i3.p2  ORF type:complete len:162 (+),score=37.01 TRINITY_DN9959_c0_g1_i3:132-617(+)
MSYAIVEHVTKLVMGSSTAIALPLLAKAVLAVTSIPAAFVNHHRAIARLVQLSVLQVAATVVHIRSAKVAIYLRARFAENATAHHALLHAKESPTATAVPTVNAVAAHMDNVTSVLEVAATVLPAMKIAQTKLIVIVQRFLRAKSVAHQHAAFAEHEASCR